MKNILFGLVMIIAALAAGLPAGAQDCPKGLINDPYPGECGRYADTNNDGYCDHSQDLAALEAAAGQIDAGQAGEIAPAADESEIVSQEENPAEKFSGEEAQVVLPAADGQKAAAPNREPVDYFMWQIALGILAAYWVSLFLAKKGKITIFNQRKFWNLVLLILFLKTAATSIILLLEINYRIAWQWPLNVGFWHIELGWAMIVTAFLHAAWHWPYFKSYFPKKKIQ